MAIDWKGPTQVIDALPPIEVYLGDAVLASLDARTFAAVIRELDGARLVQLGMQEGEAIGAKSEGV